MQSDIDYKRLFLAVFLAVGVLISWQALVEWPRRQALAEYHATEAKRTAEARKQQKQIFAAKGANIAAEENPNLTYEQRLALSPRLTIASKNLHGSIALKGARFDDVKLAKYRETLDKNSKEVSLLSPSGSETAYFAQIGWVAADNTTVVPDQNSLWQADKSTVKPNEPVTLRWNNGHGLTFVLVITLDNDYMFDIAQHVENHTNTTVSLLPYAYINRTYIEPSGHPANAIMHEGALGVSDDTLNEVSYSDLRKKNTETFENSNGWLGITDKYWLTALIPSNSHKSTFSHYTKGGVDRYQVDYLGNSIDVASGSTAAYSVRLFTGAKEVEVLDRYTDGDKQHPPVALFDRAVDFGVLYFLTKPMFLMLNFFFAHIGNFGIAILLLTIVIKLMMYPLANKSFHANAQMRELQPEMKKIRDRFVDDQISMNKEMMALYKREKVNPASGCLPVLIQMPVFFALYKVLFVTIEMRHAPFFGWIHDLSEMDTSNLFTAFGLIPWHTPTWMHLGILPILMCLTMVIQMKQQPKPTDPIQAKMISYMPYFMLIIFARMPAGLVLYWTWSNIISIFQQMVISRRHHAQKLRQQAAA